MSMLEDKANQIAADAKGESPTVVVDPATIMAIIGVITQVVKLYQDCRKSPEEAKVAMSKPHWMQKRKLRKIARKQLAENHSEEDVDSVVNGVLKQGRESSVEEITQLYDEAQ